MTGQHVKTLEDNFYDTGYRIGPINWNGSNKYGQIVSSGLYIAKLNIKLDNEFYETKSIRIAITP